jgi:hypothetical protein
MTLCASLRQNITSIHATFVPMVWILSWLYGLPDWVHIHSRTTAASRLTTRCRRPAPRNGHAQRIGSPKGRCVCSSARRFPQWLQLLLAAVGHGAAAHRVGIAAGGIGRVPFGVLAGVSHRAGGASGGSSAPASDPRWLPSCNACLLLLATASALYPTPVFIRAADGGGSLRSRPRSVA